MSVEIAMVQVSLEVQCLRKKARAASETYTTSMEIFSGGCRVWNETECGELYTFVESTHPALIYKPLVEMPHFDEIFRHLVKQLAINRKNPLGEFLEQAVYAMESALAAKEGSCVYFAEAGGRVKVGWSKQVGARITQLQTGSADPITLLGVTPGGRTKEREIHARFAADRLAGEWFTATPELLDFIRTLCRVQERQTA